MNMHNFPPCAIGTWAWGSGVNGSKMIFGKSYDEQVLLDTFVVAYERGFTLWDTAEVYGMGSSEKIVAKCIEKMKLQGKEVGISTKFMPKHKYTQGMVRSALEKSLSRLKIKAADIYWLHLPINTEQNMREFAQLKNEGKIKTIGVSNHNLDQIIQADKILSEYGCRVGAVQNHFSLIRHDDEQLKIIKWCGENGVPYFSYMVLEQGAIAGKIDDENPFPAFSLRGFEFNKRTLKKLRPLIDYERELSQKYSVSPSQIPIAWAISKGTVPIVGLTRPKYAEDLSSGAKLTLTDDEIKLLDRLSEASGIVSKGVWEQKIK